MSGEPINGGGVEVASAPTTQAVETAPVPTAPIPALAPECPILSWMDERGLTQATLAKLIGTQQSAISAYARRERGLSRRTTLRLAKESGIAVETLMAWTVGDGTTPVRRQSRANIKATVPADFHDRVRAFMGLRGETQTSLSQKIGMGITSVSRLLSGRRAVLNRDVSALARALGVGLDALLSPTWTPPSGPLEPPKPPAELVAAAYAALGVLEAHNLAPEVAAMLRAALRGGGSR